MQNEHTGAVRALKKSLSRYGIKSRNGRKAPGNPDIIVPGYKISVFVDSEPVVMEWEEELTFLNLGWTPVRFTASEILEDPDLRARYIREFIYDIESDRAKFD